MAVRRTTLETINLALEPFYKGVFRLRAPKNNRTELILREEPATCKELVPVPPKNFSPEPQIRVFTGKPEHFLFPPLPPCICPPPLPTVTLAQVFGSIYLGLKLAVIMSLFKITYDEGLWGRTEGTAKFTFETRQKIRALFKLPEEPVSDTSEEVFDVGRIKYNLILKWNKAVYGIFYVCVGIPLKTYHRVTDEVAEIICNIRRGKGVRKSEPTPIRRRMQ